MIRLEHICKSFKIAKRNSGLGAAAKALFNREYSIVKALDDVSFTINDGEMIGYIGPNGAGKSSTIKIMSGILTPDSGICEINGRTPWKKRIEHVREIGVVFGQRSQLYWDVPVIDSFELLKSIYKIPDLVYKENLDYLTTALNLKEILRTPTRQLSLGQRMRCEITASLLHNPKILFLDEPTIGLDAVSKIAVREFIRNLNKEKRTTVILTTHDMQDIEALTERILLIGKGKILLDGSLSELKKRNSYKTMILDFNGVLPQLLGGMEYKTKNKGHAEILINTEIFSIKEAVEILSAEVDILDMSIQGVSAEEMVVSLYEEFAI